MLEMIGLIVAIYLIVMFGVRYWFQRWFNAGHETWIRFTSSQCNEIALVWPFALVVFVAAYVTTIRLPGKFRQ